MWKAVMIQFLHTVIIIVEYGNRTPYLTTVVGYNYNDKPVHMTVYCVQCILYSVYVYFSTM